MAAEHEVAPNPRAFWSGTLTFGLVSVPVDLFPAARARRTALRMLGPDDQPLVRRYFLLGRWPSAEQGRHRARLRERRRQLHDRGRRGARRAGAAQVARHRLAPLRRARGDSAAAARAAVCLGAGRRTPAKPLRATATGRPARTSRGGRKSLDTTSRPPPSDAPGGAGAQECYLVATRPRRATRALATTSRGPAVEGCRRTVGGYFDGVGTPIQDLAPARRSTPVSPRSSAGEPVAQHHARQCGGGMGGLRAE